MALSRHLLSIHNLLPCPTSLEFLSDLLPPLFVMSNISHSYNALIQVCHSISTIHSVPHETRFIAEISFT